VSYCRFSSDDFQCDVYVWADVDDTWRTMVAGRRWIFDKLPEPVALPSPPTDIDHPWFKRLDRLQDMRGDPAHGHWLDLPTPEGGDSYRHATPGECADNLERLRGLGFNVPQEAIDALRREEVTR
jgi:hypothetical protein